MGYCGEIFFFFQAEDGIRDAQESRGLGDVYKRQHPNWWGMPPAILKGWVDRVVRPGLAYEFLEGDSLSLIHI